MATQLTFVVLVPESQKRLSASRSIVMLFNAFIAFFLLLFSPSTGNAAPPQSPSDSIKPSLKKIIAVIPEDLPPTYFRDAKTGDASGFAVDVMNELARLSGYEVEYIFGKPWDEMIESVRNGKADVIPSLTISPERMDLAAFTEPIEVIPVNLIVTADSGISGFAPGIKVGTLTGSIPETYMKKNLPTIEVLLYKDMQRVLFELLAGHVDAAFVLTPNLMTLAYEAGVDNKIQVISPPIFEAKRGMAVRHDDTALRDDLNQAITKFVGSPAYAGFYTKWYGKPKPFWTPIRVAELMGSLLLLVAGVLISWRYITVAGLNKRLSITADSLQATFDSVNEAIFIHDPDTGAILDVNKKMCEMYGYSHEEAIRISVERLSSGELSYRQEDALNWVKKTVQGEPQIFEWHARRRDGSLFWVEVNMRLAVIGGIRRLIVTARDITERKLAEDNLRESEENFRTFFNKSADAIFLVEHTGRIVDANDIAVERYKFSKEELLSMNVSQLDSPDDAKYALERIGRVRKFGSATFEVEHMTKDGILIYGEVSSRLITRKGATLLLSNCRDITQRKLTEEALEKSALFIEGILENVDEGFIVVQRDYRIISANKAFCENAGMKLEDIVGRHCYEVSHKNHKPCFEAGEECPVKHTFDTGMIHTALHTHFDKDGNPLYIETKSYPMKDKAGNVPSAIEICIDITEKRRLEDQLRQSQKMEAIGQLAGGIAHDFNNILTAIIGYASITKMKMKEDDVSRHNIEQVLVAAQRAAALTQSLLAFSRKQIINPVPTNLNDIVRKVEKLLTRIIGEDIELSILPDDDDIIITADAGQIEQILMNLATNARDAMPDGGLLRIATGLIEIDDEYVEAHGYGTPGKYALLSVTDSGIGMDEKIQKRIFDPFFTTKEVNKGTGLGLSMVYGIIKQHKGYINCYSEQGNGTTFKIYLPLTESEKAQDALAAATEELKGGTETILLAEDDKSVRELNTKVLEEFGYTIIAAVDGEDAVNTFMANKDNIDLFLLDIVMPKLGGVKVCEKIRQIKPGVKVIYASGYPGNFINKEGITEKGFEFISKPCSPVVLLRKVREVLDT
jgi:PAS domain S-box-containing protein